MGDMSFGTLKILATSAFYKDLIRKMVNEFFNPNVVEREVRDILSKDIEFTATLFSLIPRTANTMFGVVRGFNAYSSRFASDALVGILKGVAGDFNARYAAETLNDFFDIVQKMREGHPKLFAEIAGEKIGEFIENLDFGKLRNFAEGTAHCSLGTFEILNEKIVGNPVKLANIVATIPAFANTGIAVLNDAVSRIEMPSELLANATLTTLQSINVEEIAELAGNLSKLVNKLHEGNYILGKGDRKFKEVSEELFERFLGKLDVDSLRDAVIAFLEDLIDLSDALNNAMWKNPLIVMTLSSLLSAAVNSFLMILYRTAEKYRLFHPTSLHRFLQPY